jgi:hypothetical protein
MKKFLFILCFGFASCALFAQRQHVNHLRVGLKLGVPNIITPNIEYVTHIWEDRVAFTADFMSLDLTIDDVNVDYTDFEIGANLYLSKDGSGAYVGVSYFNFDGGGTYDNVEFDNGTVGRGTGEISYNTFNFKVGYKTGRRLYVRAEFGYGFGNIPEQITVSGSDGSSAIEDIPDIPGISSSGLIIFNIGIGYAFL